MNTIVVKNAETTASILGVNEQQKIKLKKTHEYKTVDQIIIKVLR